MTFGKVTFFLNSEEGFLLPVPLLGGNHLLLSIQYLQNATGVIISLSKH